MSADLQNELRHRRFSLLAVFEFAGYRDSSCIRTRRRSVHFDRSLDLVDAPSQPSSQLAAAAAKPDCSESSAATSLPLVETHSMLLFQLPANFQPHSNSTNTLVSPAHLRYQLPIRSCYSTGRNGRLSPWCG